MKSGYRKKKQKRCITAERGGKKEKRCITAERGEKKKEKRCITTERGGKKKQKRCINTERGKKEERGPYAKKSKSLLIYTHGFNSFHSERKKIIV